MSASRLGSAAAAALALSLSAGFVGRAASAVLPRSGGEPSGVADLLASVKAEMSAAYDAAYEAKLAAAIARIEKKYEAQLHAMESGAPSAARQLKDADNFSGLHIKRADGGVVLGIDGDVRLERTGDNQLGVTGSCSVSGSFSVEGDMTVGGQSLTEVLEAHEAACSYTSDVNANCGDATAEGNIANCCDGGGWELVYTLNIQDQANYDTASDIPYAVDNSAQLSGVAFERVAYHIQLDDEWVWVSMKAFTDDVKKVGLPVDWDIDSEFVRDVTVFSNAANLTAVNGMTQATGEIEFWSNCYGRGTSSTFDSDDTISTEDCYGSFQVHTSDGDTVFAYNAWSHSTRIGDLGFGVHSGEHPDWTFVQNADEYAVKTINAYVSRDTGMWVPFIEDVATISTLTEQVATLETTVGDLASCSNENDINARCGDASNEFLTSYCCDGGGWELVYELPIANTANYDSAADVPYTVDNSANFAGVAFERIAFHVQLDDEWVWVSMKAYTDDVTKVGLPVDWDIDSEFVRDMTILSNAANLANLTGMTQAIGEIEFWSNCYSKATSGTYDNDDTIGSEDCYGSFQVHTNDGTTVFAYNAWSSSSSRTGDLGFGVGPGEHPDWTFEANADDYTVKTIRAYVSRDAGAWTPYIEDVATISTLTEQLAETTAALEEANAKLETTTSALEALQANYFFMLGDDVCSVADNDYLMTNACDDGGWEVIYKLEIEDSANYDTTSQVPYSINNAANYAEGSFSRIGYHLRLDDEWVFVSMTAWTTTPSSLGLPVDITVDKSTVGSIHIYSNAAALADLTDTTHLTGDIEFWSNCYSSTDGTHGSDSSASTSTDCYGSFQVHTETGSTIFAYNGWSHATYNDLGIGSYTGSTHTDWTFANNAASYSVKTLTIFVLPN